MLCYIDLEHESRLTHPVLGPKHRLLRTREKARFEELSGLPCLVLRYPFVADGWVERLNPSAILISGNQTDWDRYAPGPLEAIQELVRRWERPLIGFCGGHQLIAQALGAACGPMRRLRADEADPRPDFGRGRLKELGLRPVEILAPDPLFAGLPRTVRVVEDHYWEVKTIPPDCIHLACTRTCAVQAFRHTGRPLYGLQFHPERYPEDCQDGRVILHNYFRLVREHRG